MKHVLVIDDDMFIRDLVATKLGTKYEVATFATGDEGMQSLRNSKPDLVLLDLDLPGKHGLQILQEIKNNKETFGVPVLIFSNNDDATMKQQLLNAGADKIFLKVSLDMSELLMQVDKCLT